MTGEFLLKKPPLPDDGLDAYAAVPNGRVKGRRATRRRPREEFIRGPLPLAWMGKAARLPGQALAVALAIWFRRGIEQKDSLSLYPSALERFGVNRWSGYRALEALEGAGLVRVSRKQGRAPVVTIIQRPTSADGTGA
jgi:hypothetical protein